jgi:predicted nucleic acid-binding protein
VAVRRGRIEATFRDAALADLTLLDITTDQLTDGQAWRETLALAETFGLTLYDAAYLELAQRRKLPLATLDRQLHDAALKAGTRTLG